MEEAFAKGATMRYVLALGIVLVCASFVEASKQTVTKPTSGKEVVVHTRAAPVVVHRIFPPYGIGKHVYTPRAK
jgi:hypothetical protein